MKPDTAISPRTHCIPDFSNNVQYEVELVIRINRLGKHIEEKFAHKYYEQIGLGIDFTARDIQQVVEKSCCLGKKPKDLMGLLLSRENI